MATENFELRERLCSLWKTFLHNAEGSLLEDAIIPDKFLEENNIRLIPHEFSTADTETPNLNQNPPILFEPCSLKVIHDGPIDVSLWGDLEQAEEDLEYPEYKKVLNKQLKIFVETAGWKLVDYLCRWVFAGFPRSISQYVDCFAETRGIMPVSDHGEGIPYLVNGIGFNGYGHQKYSTRVFKYISQCVCRVCSHPKRDVTPPHVILVGVQENIIGHDERITYGELASIVTAMRYRAFDPSVIEESDDDEDWVERGDLLFKNERRFPVIMVSIVRPQKARIYYACMDGLDLIIRQSKLYDMEKKDTALLDFLATILLSEPLIEDQLLDKGLEGGKRASLDDREVLKEIKNVPVVPIVEEKPLV